MHVVAPQPSDEFLPLFFTVNASVGERGANSSVEDIQLVQFMLRQIAAAETAGNPANESRRQRMLKVPMSGMCIPGTTDARLTIDGIRAYQEICRTGIPGTPVDGRVDPTHSYRLGSAQWTMVNLNISFKGKFPQIWPRLQDHPNCPGVLKTRVPLVL